MQNAHIVDLEDAANSPHDFMKLVQEHGHVVVTNHGAPIAMVHAVEDEVHAWHKVRALAETGLCPDPDPEMRVKDLGRFLRTAAGNLKSLTSRRAEIILLEEEMYVVCLAVQLFAEDITWLAISAYLEVHPIEWNEGDPAVPTSELENHLG